MSPSDILKAYDITPLRNQHVDGSGETVTFFEIDGFRQKDLDAYTRKFGLPHQTGSQGAVAPAAG